MKFSITALALASAVAAQSLTDVGLTCNNLYGDRNPHKLDPNGWYVIERSLCESTGGKLYNNDIICCPPKDTGLDGYSGGCNTMGGTVHWGTQAVEGWKCPK